MASPHRVHNTSCSIAACVPTRSTQASQTLTGASAAIAAPHTRQSEGIKMFVKSATVHFIAVLQLRSTRVTARHPDSPS